MQVLHINLITFHRDLFSSDVVKEVDQTHLNAPELTSDHLAMLTEPGVPPHQLPLKENAIAAIQRILSVPNALVRNARVRIVTLHRRIIEVQLLDDGTIHCIPRICFSFNAAHCSWTILRRQCPLRLAYATTFNGCQG